MHSLGYVDLTQLVIFESEEFLSSKIRLTDLPEGFCCSSCTPIKGRMFLPRLFARLSSTTIGEAVMTVHAPDSIDAMILPNVGIYNRPL